MKYSFHNTVLKKGRSFPQIESDHLERKAI